MTNTRQDKLRSALRDNLKKRKSQARKLKADENFAVKLRKRDIAKTDKTQDKQ